MAKDEPTTDENFQSPWRLTFRLFVFAALTIMLLGGKQILPSMIVQICCFWTAWYLVAGGPCFFQSMSFDPVWMSDESPKWVISPAYSLIHIVKSTVAVLPIFLSFLSIRFDPRFSSFLHTTAIMLLAAPILWPPVHAKGDYSPAITFLKNVLTSALSKVIMLTAIGLIVIIIPWRIPPIFESGSATIPYAFVAVAMTLLFSRGVNASLLSKEQPDPALRRSFASIALTIGPRGIGGLVMIYLLGSLEGTPPIGLASGNDKFVVAGIATGVLVTAFNP